MKDPKKILIRPLITEKISALQEKQNQYGFEVDRNANKIEIRRAVEERFNVDVAKVRTMNINGKMKTLGRFTGRRSSWKKAIVSLKQGQSIEFFENI
ncbi:MAG: 50S ribosomal protein L23 [candidate division Zixibacteria bacterium]|nr:50S ribosomal protein L23 [Candidatus Tariuqbacter arcticus]